MELAALSALIRERLDLDFDPEERQTTLIQRIKQGFDSIFVAGTGYGKSLIFQGLAAASRAGKITMVITPLKALERDQVRRRYYPPSRD